MVFEGRMRFKSGIYDHARFNISKKPGSICNILIFGLPRQGKTVKLMDYATKAHAYRRDKVWDIWDARRGENAMYPLPSKFLYWKNGRTDGWGRVFKATGFPTTLFFPMCQKLPKEIPAPGRVFTIPLTSLEFEDIIALVGNELNPNIKPLWNALQKRYITKRTTMPELLKIIDDLPKLKVDSGKGYVYSPPSKQVCGTLKRALEMLDNEKIISSEVCSTCLSIKDEYKKRDISSFVMVYTEDWFAMWLAQWLIRNIYKQLREIPHKRASVMVVRELSDLCPRKITMPSQLVISANIEEIMKQGIGSANLYFLADTQQPNQIGAIRGMFGVNILFKIRLSDDIDQLMNEESRLYFTAMDKLRIPTLKVGQCLTFTSEGRWLGRSIPPRCRIKKQEEDIEEIWQKEYSAGGFATPFIYSLKWTDLIDLDYSEGIKRNLLRKEKQKYDAQRKKKKGTITKEEEEDLEEMEEDEEEQEIEMPVVELEQKPPIAKKPELDYTDPWDF